MPFSKPFRDIFHQDDIIYGLSNQRAIYVYNKNIDSFKLAKTRFVNNDCPPIIIDDYLIPVEKKRFIYLFIIVRVSACGVPYPACHAG